jgi:hypothetical protein
MSATQVKSALAIAILIAAIGPSGAQEAIASLESTSIAAGAGTSLSLSENSWDFTKPDSIPGFGTLPQSYDARAVLPRFSGE